MFVASRRDLCGLLSALGSAPLLKHLHLPQNIRPALLLWHALVNVGLLQRLRHCPIQQRDGKLLSGPGLPAQRSHQNGTVQWRGGRRPGRMFVASRRDLCGLLSALGSAPLLKHLHLPQNIRPALLLWHALVNVGLLQRLRHCPIQQRDCKLLSGPGLPAQRSHQNGTVQWRGGRRPGRMFAASRRDLCGLLSALGNAPLDLPCGAGMLWSTRGLLQKLRYCTSQQKDCEFLSGPGLPAQRGQWKQTGQWLGGRRPDRKLAPSQSDLGGLLSAHGRSPSVKSLDLSQKVAVELVVGLRHCSKLTPPSIHFLDKTTNVLKPSCSEILGVCAACGKPVLTE